MISWRAQQRDNVAKIIAITVKFLESFFPGN